MRKRLSFILALVMVFSLLSGCSKNASGSSPADSESNTPVENTESASSTAAASGDFDAFARPTIWKDDGAPFKVAVMIQWVTSTAALRSMKQMDIIGNHYNWEFEYVLFEKPDNFRDSFQAILNEGDVDAILIHATDNLNSRADLIAEARKRGIGVYAWDADVAPGIITNVQQAGGNIAVDLFYAMYRDIYDGSEPFTIATLEWPSMYFFNERSYPWNALGDAIPQCKTVAREDISAVALQYGSAYSAYQTVLAWESKYDLSESIKAINGLCDDAVYGAVEAVKATGDLHGEYTKVSTTEGGDTALTYLRSNSPLKYVYCQPYELMTYNVCEIIKEIQIDGLNPGDAGCILSKAGTPYYVQGTVVTEDTCPAVGVEYHSIFNYYGGNPDDTDAWWNWDTEEFPNNTVADSQYESNF